MLPPVRGTTTTTTPSSMAADPRYKLARLAEAHGILQRDHAGALERTTTAEAARKKLETALEARDIRIEELEDALTTLSEQARAFEASAREQRAKAEGRVAADALEAERHARQTAEASANEAAGALTRAGAECAAASEATTGRGSAPSLLWRFLEVAIDSPTGGLKSEAAPGSADATPGDPGQKVLSLLDFCLEKHGVSIMGPVILARLKCLAGRLRRPSRP